MPVTTHYAIPYPDGTTGLTPLANKFADIANGVDAALFAGLAGAPLVGNADSDRIILYPAAVQGNLILRPDKGWIESYYALYNSSTNPAGAIGGAGWYPIAGSLPAVRVARASGLNTSGTINTFVGIAWDTDIYNPIGTMHNTSSNNSRLIAPVSGYYNVWGKTRVTTAGQATIVIAKNGTQIGDTTVAGIAAGSNPFLATSDLVYLNSGDYVEVLVSSSVASQAITLANANMTYVRP